MVKRLFDLLVSLTLFLFLLFPLVIVGVLIRVKIGGPVLFKQKRPGLNGEIFEMVKFRTMTNQVDEHGNLLPDELRLTKFGALLRSLSIDELPELWNVVKGEMSLVGPRPLLKEYLPLYNDFQMRRHEVKPGITGLAQISGRNNLSWTEKFDLDVWYVDNRNFLLDMKIIFLTVKKVFIREGITSSGSATSEGFKGN